MNHRADGYTCPACKATNSPSAKHCIECGHWLLDTIHEAKPIMWKNQIRKSKKSIFKRWWFWLIAAFIVFVIIPGLANNQSSVPTSSLDEIMASAVEIPYDDLARNAKQLIGHEVHYVGTVIQVIESPPVLRINIAKLKPGEFISANEIIYITRKDNAGRVLENDTVEIWGTVKGLKTYTPWTGAPITIPEVTSHYLVVIKKAGEK